MTAELGRLEDAIFRLTCELDQAHAATDEHRVLLEQAVELRVALEGDLRRQRMTAEIRARLLSDIFSSRLLGRRAAIERAARVERLLSRAR